MSTEQKESDNKVLTLSELSNLEGEVWKIIPGDEFESKYSISNYGRVISRRRNPNGKLMIPIKSNFGALKVTITGKKQDGTRKYRTKNIYIKMMVAKMFIPNPNEWKHVISRDGDKNNCVVDNLYWSRDLTRKSPQFHSSHILIDTPSKDSVVKPIKLSEYFRSRVDLVGPKTERRAKKGCANSLLTR